MIEIMDQLSPAVMNSFVHVAVSDSVSVYLLDICVKSSKYRATVTVLQIVDFLFWIIYARLHCPLSVHIASQPPCRPAVVGGVVGPAGEQLV